MRVVRLLPYGLCLLMLLKGTIGSADGNTRLAPPDFQATSQKAEQQNIPIMVLFSATDCDYCLYVKEEFIGPMLMGNAYINKALIRIVEIDSSNYLRDFNGKMIFPDELADRYNIQLTPTVAFLDARGRKLTNHITGIGTIDYYGNYLDEAINTSQKIINQQ